MFVVYFYVPPPSQFKHFSKINKAKYYFYLPKVFHVLDMKTLELLSPTELNFPGGSDGKASVYNAGDLGLIPGLGRSPAEGNGNPLQYSCLENPMDGGTWEAAVHGVATSRTRLSDFTFSFTDLKKAEV